MKIKMPLPVPDPDGQFLPQHFAQILASLPEDCILIGGQAVVWWAQRYGLSDDKVASKDIDILGGRDELTSIANTLKKTAAFPDRREMTLLVGAIPLTADNKKTCLEMLHTLPGIDSPNPDTIAITQTIEFLGKQCEFKVLTPVSLVLVKTHALRSFDQTDRQDLAHLKLSLEASAQYLTELLETDPRQVLWNCNRLIDTHKVKPVKKMEEAHNLNLLDAIPIDAIRAAAERIPPCEEQDRLKRFLEHQWPRQKASDAGDAEEVAP